MMDLHQMDGMFVGLLSDDEIEVFNRAVKAGQARRVYEGGGGFMGLAKVRLVREPSHSSQERG
jgi:hypothetical protein